MLRKFLLISLVLGTSTGAFATLDNRNQTEVINAVYDHLQDNGYLNDITATEKSAVIDLIKNEVEESFNRVDAGELSLDTDAGNYFLFDTIKDVVSGIGDVIKGVVKVAKKIGGKVFNALKGALGTIVDAGLQFLSIVDNDFIKSVIGTAADAFGVFIAGAGDTLAAASLVIPGVGEVVAPIVASLSTMAPLVINADNLSAAADVVGMVSRGILKVKDADIESGFSKDTKSHLAPNPDSLFDSVHKKDSETAKKVQVAQNLGKVCHGLMKHLAKLSADKYNALPKNVKEGAAHCNHFAGSINARTSN